jgi:hypothetical protein
MTNSKRAAVFIFFCLLCSQNAFSFPMFLDAFRADAYRRVTVDGCGTCHVSPQGGGDRNPFGQAFEAGGETITPLLRVNWPDRFDYPTSLSGGLTVHFSDPANRQAVVEVSGVKTLLDLTARTAGGQAASAPAVNTSAPATQTPTASVEGGVDPFAREGALFGMNVVNLPNGKPQRKGGVDFVVAHRFSQSVYRYDAEGNRRWNSMLGFDSAAYVSYGFKFGATDRLSLGFLRTTIDNAMEFNSMLNITRQARDASPLTLALRTGIEVKNNFRDQPAPFIEPVVTHTIKDRVSVVLTPIFAFNTRNEELPTTLMIDPDHNHTISLGLGTGIRVGPSMSVVGEWIPRLWGFKGLRRDRAGFSLGLQKSTFRHTFEFVLSRQESMTTSQTAIQAGRFGNDTFRIGFNIYRKLH